MPLLSTAQPTQTLLPWTMHLKVDWTVALTKLNAPAHLATNKE